MYKKMLWIMSLAFSLILSPMVLADDWGCGEGLKQMVTSLNLTAEQKDQINPIMEKLKTRKNEIGMQMKEIDMQINQQVDSDAIDKASVDGLIDKKSRLIGDMIKAKMLASNQIFDILNVQQKMQLKDMMKRLEDKVSAKFQQCHEQD